MSIKYNNEIVAGKYKSQIIPPADTVNSGTIRIATQEEVDAGESNTTAVTPQYLSTKQDKLVAGDNILLDENLIECTVYPDDTTIIQNEDGTLTNIAQKTVNGNIKFDWSGTVVEYEHDMLNGTIQPDWYCYITDDEQIVDFSNVPNINLDNLTDSAIENINTIINNNTDNKFLNKADIDLSNITEIGQAKFDEKAYASEVLNKSQITNCLLEVPQRIKLELNNGVLTLKSGSEVIVPNGFEADGTTPKFDYVTVASDISETSKLNTTCMVSLCTDDNTLIFRTIVNYQSGTQSPSSQINNSNYYYTDTNLVKDKTTGGTVRGSSLPIAIVNVSSTQIISINQVFNGMGYIGSIVWAGQGIKGLIPNGRNEDGTLNNIEFTTDKVTTITVRDPITYFGFKLENSLNVGLYGEWLYNENTNTVQIGDIRYSWMYAGRLTYANGNITSFNPKLPFRAVDYNDLNMSQIGMPILTLESTLKPNEIWLEGATVNRITYDLLFYIYGTTYGEGDGSTTFTLPDFRNRAIWGSSEFGYIDAGLPNITGILDGTHDVGVFDYGTSGAFALGSATSRFASSATGANAFLNVSFNASRSSSIYGNSSTVQPPAIKVRVKTKYK